MGIRLAKINIIGLAVLAAAALLFLFGPSIHRCMFGEQIQWYNMLHLMYIIAAVVGIIAFLWRQPSWLVTLFITISILVVIVLSSVNNTRRKAPDAKRVSDIQAIVIALDQYADQNGSYPIALAELVPSFMSAVPQDPGVCRAVPRYATCDPDGSGPLGPIRVHIGSAPLDAATSSSLENDSDCDTTSATGPCRASVVCSGTAPTWTGGFDGTDPIYDVLR